jgi:hypothetical protein
MNCKGFVRSGRALIEVLSRQSRGRVHGSRGPCLYAGGLGRGSCCVCVSDVLASVDVVAIGLMCKTPRSFSESGVSPRDGCVTLSVHVICNGSWAVLPPILHPGRGGGVFCGAASL